MPRELADCVERANLDPEVHVIAVIALAGNGSGFCGGYDLVASAERMSTNESRDERRLPDRLRLLRGPLPDQLATVRGLAHRSAEKAANRHQQDDAGDRAGKRGSDQDLLQPVVRPTGRLPFIHPPCPWLAHAPRP
jgi:hypothetical protein